MSTVKLNGKTNEFQFEGRTYKMNRVNDSVGGESSTYTLEGIKREGELRNLKGEVYGHWFSLQSITDGQGDAHRHSFTFEAYFA